MHRQTSDVDINKVKSSPEKQKVQTCQPSQAKSAQGELSRQEHTSEPTLHTEKTTPEIRLNECEDTTPTPEPNETSKPASQSLSVPATQDSTDEPQSSVDTKKGDSNTDS